MATEQFLSLSEDDFEVIQSGVDSTYRSIDPSLNESLVLHPMLVSTATLVDETIKEEDHSTKNDHLETGLLNCSVSAASTTSSDISEMLRSQSDTISMMEKQLSVMQQFSLINDSIKNSLSLKEKVEELEAKAEEREKEKERLERELAEMGEKMMSLRTINETMGEERRREIEEELRKKDAMIASLSSQVVSLEQTVKEEKRKTEVEQESVLTRAPSFDEVQSLRKENEKLKKNVADLSFQLSEECARRIHMQEMSGMLQNSLNSMQMTGAISVENQQTTRAIQKMMDKSEECEEKAKRIRELEAELQSLKGEREDKEEIIKVLQEENNEGTRMLAENRRKISNMKSKLERYGHFSDF